MSFSPYYGRCEMFLEYSSEVLLLMMMSVEMLVYVVPVIVVTTSCIVSTVLLVKRREEHLVGLQRSRNKATVTILLFALLYGICNVPLVVRKVLRNYTFNISKNWEDFYDIYKFDSQDYFHSASLTLLIAVNSAANPVLYFWRMDRLREFVLSRMKKLCCTVQRRERVSNNIFPPHERQIIVRTYQASHVH